MLALAGVLIGLQALRFILIMHNALRTRVRKPGMRLVPAESVPLHVRDGLQPPIAELIALGFEPAGWVCADRATCLGGDPLHLAWLFHPAERACASVAFADIPDSLNLYSVTLRTFADGTRSVVTLNGISHANLGAIPEAVLADPYAATLEGQWQEHRQAVVRSGLLPATLTAEAAVERAAAQESGQIDALVAKGRLVPVSDGTFEFGWTAAAALAARSVAATRRVQDLRSRRARALKKAAKPMALPPVEEDVATYKRIDELIRAPARRSFFLWIFAVSLVLFAASIATSRETAFNGAIVAGVILFHELGHYLAMRAFGYQDTTIFFIPFLGGAAAGRKADATLGQQIMVLLAGPLPGLIAAGVAALLGAGKVPHLNVALWALISINLFNLLPILPLDGGRIVHALLFARNAWLDVALRTIGVALFALLAISSSNPVLLGLTFVIALGIPHGFRLAALRHGFNQALIKTPAESRVSLFFHMLHEKGRGALPCATKMQLARGVLLESSSVATPRFASICFWFIGYLGSLLAGGLAAVAVVTVGGRAGPPRATTPHWMPLAPLACPASSLPSRSAQASLRTTQVTSIAVFDEAAAAVEAKQAIQRAIQPAHAASLGIVLFLGSPLERSDQTYERSSAERSARMAQMDRMVLERGGAVTQLGGGSGAMLAIQCTARSVAEARGVEDDLSDYFAAGLTLDIRPPWIGEMTATERQARHTYRIASSASQASIKKSLRWSGVKTLWANLRGRLGAGQSSPVALRKEWEERARATIDERRALEPLDDEVARLSIASFSFERSRSEDGRRARRELRDRLGGADETEIRLMGRTTRTDASVTTEFPWLSTTAVQSDLPALLHWLCSRSCESPVLMITAAEATTPDARAQAYAAPR
ncbi:MAG TPA: site-2 protease family protein [Myxococcales bacterium]|nr:site-2 protease family protein [Myxococcales bacterium]